MKPSFRLVHFCPDPFSGARFPLGAVIEGERVHIARAPQVPDAHCVGGAQKAALARMIHARLGGLSLRHSSELPDVLGPYVSLSEPSEVPARLEDPAEIQSWIMRVFFSADEAEQADEEHPTVRAPSPRAYGKRFFTTHGVARFVRSNYRPESQLPARFRPSGPLHPITHWVGDEREVMLMEPVVPEREKFESDIERINTKFASYRFLLADVPASDLQANLCAFILRGGSRRERDYARRSLGDSAHYIVDIESDRERREFVERVKSLGLKAESQSHFPLDS